MLAVFENNFKHFRRLFSVRYLCTTKFSVRSTRRNHNYLSKCTTDSFRVPMVTSMFDQSPRLLSTLPNESEIVDAVTFEKVCEDTLESLSDYFEELVENVQHLNTADVAYSSGVLTVAFGAPYGTYVINRQSPNRQIWLSSPVSGPKRYDYDLNKKSWIYKHDGRSMHQLLQEEIPEIVKTTVDFSKCVYSII